MRIEKRIVDLEAYISGLGCIIKTVDNKKQLYFSFKNRNHGTIEAIRLLCTAYDSFGDKIQFEGKDFLEIKRADLQAKPFKNVSFYIDINVNDVKKVEVSVTQLVYTDGEKIIPKKSKIVEYEVEILSSSWSPEDHFEKDALLIMQEKNNQAICFPKVHPMGWICVCGMLNPESENNCAECGSDRQMIFTRFGEEIIKLEIEKREKKEREESEKRKEQQKKEQEREKRKRKTIRISAICAIVLAIIIGTVCAVTYNIKYGLSDEEKVQYDIAQSNDFKIQGYVMELEHEFFDIAIGYMEKYDDSYERENRMSEAEKNEDFLYARGIYMAAPMLYDLIEDQYPEKYRNTYVQLIKMRKGEVYTDILANETRYIINSNASDLADRQDKIKEAINITEEYMDKDVLDPAKIEIPNVDIPNPDYSKVYGINLGILFYEDGNIRYIGETTDGKANGFGKCWYLENDGGKSWCEGIFEDGIFKSGDNCFDAQGNRISASELSNVEIAGDFKIVQGLSNTISSEKDVESPFIGTWYCARENSCNDMDITLEIYPVDISGKIKLYYERDMKSSTGVGSSNITGTIDIPTSDSVRISDLNNAKWTVSGSNLIEIFTDNENRTNTYSK